MQKRFYESHATDLDRAKHLVHPDFDLAKRQAESTAMYILTHYVTRTLTRSRGGCSLQEALSTTSTFPKSIRLLDFGCGIGRLMEPFSRADLAVDGVDISEKMINFSKANPILGHSAFFVSSGLDCGEAPDNSYDVCYSQLCFQHIASRKIRRRLLESISGKLVSNGIICIQMHYYPDHTSNTIPKPHVEYNKDEFDAKSTNSDADVWITPDSLGRLVEDVSEHFVDIQLQIIDFPDEAKLFTEFYNSVRFSHIWIVASRSHALAERYYHPVGAERS